MVKTSSSRTKKSSSKSAIQDNSPSVAIFQWLSYAFWGWTAVATAALIATCVNFALNGYSSNYESVAYVVAAALVLLPIAFVCDILFSRQERNEKNRVGMVIMVIHAVLYTLITVGALATLVFSLVGMVISDTADINSQIVTAVTAASVVVFLGILVVRIMKPMVGTSFRTIVRGVLTLIVLLAMIWGIASPVAQTIMRKDDDRAKQAVELVQLYINSYVGNEDALPATISEAVDANKALLGDVEARTITSAAEDGLITYRSNTQPAVDVNNDSIDGQRSHFYELCVTYAYADENRDNSNQYYSSSPDAYLGDVPGSSTEAGTECYEIKADYLGGVKPL